jgi:hypothetical protein
MIDLMNDTTGGKSVRPTAAQMMTWLGLDPDPWQVEVIDGGHKQLLLNACRQAGKSTAVALLALMETLFLSGRTVLLLSRSYRQSAELFRTVRRLYRLMRAPMQQRLTYEVLELTNQSRIVCLPCREETIRGYANVHLLVIDEAARVPDELYRAVRPMLAVSGGRIVCLSTPYGKRGFFWEAWAKGGKDWARIEVPAERVARIGPAHLEMERRALGEPWYQQAYGCSFASVEGLVYPDFRRCVVQGPAPAGDKVGGIDFGLRNPFAAVWGVRDRDEVLWLTGEHYSREKTLAYHAQHLPKGVLWYADPSGAQEILELRCADVRVRPGNNERRLGIAAVRARIETGTLRIVEGACPNLLTEAELYRYEPENGSELPCKEDDHALDTLRYLISTLDQRRMVRMGMGRPAPESSAPPAEQPPPRREQRKWLSIWNEQLWTRIG